MAHSSKSESTNTANKQVDKLSVAEYARRYLDIELLPIQIRMIEGWQKNTSYYFARQSGKTTAWRAYQKHLKYLEQIIRKKATPTK